MVKKKETVNPVDALLTTPQAVEYATAKDVSALADAVIALSKKIDSMGQKVTTTVRTTVSNDDPAKSFPKLYRQIIDEILSHEFPATVEWRTDGNFELTIEVPSKYSNATPSYLSTYKKDSRVKVIPNALAENGVREYAQAVARNLGEVIMNNVKLAK